VGVTDINVNRILEPIIELGAIAALMLLIMIGLVFCCWVLFKELKETRVKLIDIGADNNKLMAAIQTTLNHLVDLVKDRR
jgi:uncharacterized membrane protein YqjE